jgi:hypothetical protein
MLGQVMPGYAKLSDIRVCMDRLGHVRPGYYM